MERINLRGTGVYHPERQVGNDYYLKYFSEQGKDIRPILLATGRQTRYLSDQPDENSMTMAAKACEMALDSAKLTGQDIDMLIFSSGTPEYLAPTNALKIHKLIHCRNDVIAYDMNANCVGMIIAVEQASRVMLSNKHIHRALVVGSEQMNKFSKKSDEITTSNFGDAACAVILEKAEEGDSGFRDSVFFSNSSNDNNMTFPEVGMSNIYDPSISEDKKRIFWPGGVGDKSFKSAAKLIGQLLERNDLSASDINRFFLSQLCLKNIRSIAEILNVDMNTIEFVGDKYGYTGTSSPFLALHHAIKGKRVHKGDNIIFWSIGTGVETCAVLWKL